MNRVFVSYAAPDQATARIVVEALHSHGLETWSDRDLTVGSKWATEIMAALESSDAVLVLVTPASLASNWVSQEWSTGLA